MFFFFFQSESLENSIAISADSSVFSGIYGLNNNWNDELNLASENKPLYCDFHARKFVLLAR